MIGRWIISFAFFLNSSASYRRIKKLCYNVLENSSNPYKKIVDYTMIALILISVYILIRQVKYDIGEGWLFFNNYVISIIFLVEYILRMWIYSDISRVFIDQYEHDAFLQRTFRWDKALKKAFFVKVRYMTSPAAIIDLLAIMPFFHELRMLRIFILFRVFKLFRYAKSLSQFVSILSSKKFEIFTLGLFSTVIVLVSSVLIYVMEANNPNSPIDTLFEAVYWSVVTIFTVGYGDFVPATDEGRMVAMVIIIAGIAVISFATSIVVSAFTEKLDQIKEEKMIDDVTKIDQFYLICGVTPLGLLICRRLRRQGKKVVIFEKDEEKIEEAQKEGFLALSLDPSSVYSYYSARIDFDRNVISAILVQESDVLNVYTALTIRELSKKVKLLSILVQQENRKKLSLAGINEIVYTQELVGLISKEVSGRPVAFEVIHALRSENTDVHIEEIVLDSITVKSFFLTCKKELFARRLIILGIYKTKMDQFFFNPYENLALEEGDIAIVIGSRPLIDEFRSLMLKKGQR